MTIKGGRVRIGTRLALTAAMMTVGHVGVAAGQEVSNLMGRFERPLVVYHLFSTSDGTSAIEPMRLPTASLDGPRAALVSRPATGINVFARPPGDWSPWHQATERYLVTVLQGEYIIDVGDGKEHRLLPGNVLYAEDWSGRGHRTLCKARGVAKQCVLQQVILEPIDRTVPLRKR